MIDIPYVTADGLALAIAVVINSSIILFLVWLISKFLKDKIKKQIVFQDYIFVFSISAVMEYLLLNSGMAHNQALDYLECVKIFLLGYVCIFRFKHWEY